MTTHATPRSGTAEPSAVLAPLLREVERIATAAERSVGCDHEREMRAMRLEMTAMQREIDRLRETVAYLRMMTRYGQPGHSGVHIGQ